MVIQGLNQYLIKSLTVSFFILLLFTPFSSAVSEASADEATQISTRIINGSTAKARDWPWMVALLTHSESDNFYAQYCGGVLVQSRWVVTAAHCLYTNGVRDTDRTTDVLVRTNSLSQGGVRILVDHSYIHPDFDVKSANFENDIALLHLFSPAQGVEPIRLPGTSYDLPVAAAGTDSIVMGWGTTTTGTQDKKYPEQLMQVDLPIISTQACQRYFGDVALTDKHLCAGFIEGGKDSCQGDSGGPLISQVSGEYNIVGITSWGRGCARSESPGIYTRVAKYEKFISDHICSSKPETPVLQQTYTTGKQGDITLKLDFSEIDSADYYRLYYAPYVPAGKAIENIAYIDMQQSLTVTIPADTRYYAAGQAINNNCASDFSNLIATP